MANDVEHDAMTPAQASSAAVTLAATSQRGGDPEIRRAGTQLADAYRAKDDGAVSSAITEFTRACAW
jgi:hypothetical protein